MKTVMKRLMAVCVTVMVLGLWGQDAHAVLAPHNHTNAIDCHDCHNLLMWGGDPLAQPGPKFLLKCERCHQNNTGSGYDRNNAPFVKTHSAANVGSTRYGDWVMACNDCHGHRIDTSPVVVGTFSGYVMGVNSTSFTIDLPYTVNNDLYEDVTTWSAKRGAERGLLFAVKYLDPDGNCGENIVDCYTTDSMEVLGASGNTVTVAGLVSLPEGLVLDGTFEVFYSQFVKAIPNASNIVDPATGKPYVALHTSPNTFADDDSGLGTDLSPNGICQVCHTQTRHWRSDGTLAEMHFSGKDCLDCHDHKKGFKPRCDLCHGAPPIVDATQPDAPDGSVGLVHDPAPTGATSAGAHSLHATPAGYDFSCTACHFNGMPASDVQGNNKIQIGFSVYGYSGNDTFYDGHTLLPPYDYEGTNGTVVTTGGSLRCSNVYCHSQGKRLVQGFDLPSLSPSWDGSSADPQGDTNKCNNCHGFPPTFDSHRYHVVRGFKCNICHAGTTPNNVEIGDYSLHINGVYDVIPADQFYARKEWHDLSLIYTPGNGEGGVCSSNLCHQYFNFKDPKQWSKRPQFISSASLAVTQGQCVLPEGEISSPSSTVTVKATAVCGDCVQPYTCDFEWGDGTVDYGVSCTTPHTYADKIFSPYDPTGTVIGGFDVRWRIRDSFFVSLPEAWQTTRVNVCPLPNVLPVVNSNLYLGPNPATYDLCLNDLSYDIDYNLGTHYDPNGTIPGQIYINWGDFYNPGSVMTQNITLTANPSNVTYCYTYPWRSYWTIQHGIKDNSGEGDFIMSPVRRIKVTLN